MKRQKRINLLYERALSEDLKQKTKRGSGKDKPNVIYPRKVLYCYGYASSTTLFYERSTTVDVLVLDGRD